ncbi:MAG: DUF192 domain-containing protein [Halobacteriota archaeon]
MEVTHDEREPDGREADDQTARTIATEVELATSRLAQARGLMFRRSIPDEYALVFPFEGAKPRDLHMVFVPFPIDAIWTVEGVVTHVKRLRPWIGFGKASADTIVELPAGAAASVAVGDRIEIVD